MAKKTSGGFRNRERSVLRYFHCGGIILLGLNKASHASCGI